jgi:hypothetical protein
LGLREGGRLFPIEIPDNSSSVSKGEAKENIFSHFNENNIENISPEKEPDSQPQCLI